MQRRPGLETSHVSNMYAAPGRAGSPYRTVSHSHRHMAELLQLEYALGGKLQHLHRWFWDRHVHRASQEACGESVCTIACTCIATLGITHTTHFTEVLVKAFQSVLLNS